MSSLADSDLQASLAESQRGIPELKDIVIKKFGEEKPDDPRLGFCDFQLTDETETQAKVPTQDGHEHGADRHLQPGLNLTPLHSVSHTDAGTSADATDFYTCNARAVTAAATAFIAAATAYTLFTAAATALQHVQQHY